MLKNMSCRRSSLKRVSLMLALCIAFILALSLTNAAAPCDENSLDQRWLQDATEAPTEEVFVNKDLDELLKSFPPEVFDGMAVAGIVLGLLLAFFGLRVLWLTAFVCGAVVGGFAGALVLNYIDDVTGDTWLAIVGACALASGLFVACMVKMARILVGVAFALLLVGMVIQTGLADTIGDNVVIWVLLGILVIVFAFVSYKSFEFMLVLASAIAGGVFVMLGLSRFLEAGISIYAIYQDPESVLCTSSNCVIVLVTGSVVALLGGFYQLIRLRKKLNGGKKKKKNNENRNESDSDSDVRQVQRQQSKQVDKRISLMQQQNDAKLQAVSRDVLQREKSQRLEMDELRRTLDIVQNERVHAMQDKARDVERMNMLEHEINQAKRQSMSSQRSTVTATAVESDSYAMLMKSLTQQVQVLTRMQEANEGDKQQLAVRNADLERQVSEAQAYADRMEMKRQTKASPTVRDQVAIDELKKERVMLAEALDEATRERAVAKMEAERALELLEDMEEQLRGGGGGGEGGEELKLKLSLLKSRQQMFQDDYHLLQTENVDLMKRLDTASQMSANAAAAAQASAVFISIDGDTNPASEGARMSKPVSMNDDTVVGVAGSTHARPLLNLQGSDHFEEELEDVMEDQIDWKELARDLGAGLKELAVALWAGIVWVTLHVSACVSDKAKEAKQNREMKRTHEGKKDLNAEAWINEFRSPTPNANFRASDAL